ncbi:MAG: type VI secretion system baseplate subunit TssF [Desulfovibrio sp.]|nr:type VI secretion system baseplate subunit TssF [Desulfovibrio sp.]MBI4959148.1 type VI secretion system baseplate subunit TssF [Desulfovibrio sp.]
MINRYYQRELANLRDLAAEFSKKHPALAPMLSGPSQDPDVERLLEGTAFLSGLLAQKLDDEFPEIIHGLMRLVFPHYLSPVPSMTILKFTPKRSLLEALQVPAGTQTSSIPVEGTGCTFTTCYGVELLPLALTDVSLLQTGGRASALKLSFELTGMQLDKWTSKKLRLHLAGDYGHAADRYLALMRHTARITLRATDGGGTPAVLPKSSLVPVGFGEDEAAIPYPKQSYPGYRILQEYFTLPEKFLFLDVKGLDQWLDRGQGRSFEMLFEFMAPVNDPPAFPRDSVALFATPAINLFPHEADPILLDHRMPEYKVFASGGATGHYQVYSVDKVIGFQQGSVGQREYYPFEMFNPMSEARPVYSLNHRQSALEEKTDLYLSVAYPKGTTEPQTETLSLTIRCTNSTLPENLQIGDISKPTETSPVLADFSNLRPPTATRQPPIGKESLWRLLSHLYLNYLPMADTENLKALVKLYIFPETKDRAGVLAGIKRAEAISEMNVETTNRLVGGVMMRGQLIEMKLDPTGFASMGDMYLFGSVLDGFLGGYAAVNCFTRLGVEDVYKKERFEWPARIGERFLL